MKHALLFLCAIITLNSLQAQPFLGIRNSNYAGIQGAFLNPSSIVDSKLKWDVNLLSVGALYDNTFLVIPKDSLSLFAFKKIIKDVIDQNQFATYYSTQNPDELFQFTFSTEVIGPSVMFNIAHKHEIGITTAARSYTNIEDITGNFAQNAFDFLLNDHLWKTTFHDNSAKLNTLSWFEYGLNYATILSSGKKYEIKGGISLKYLQGVAGAYFNNTNITYNIVDTTQLIFTNSSIDYGRTDYTSFKNIDGYGDLIHGNGFGGNIGFTYVRLRDSSEYTYEMDCKRWQDPNKSNYIYRIGLSLIDAGTIKFNKNSAKYHLETDSANYINWKYSHFTNNIQLDKSLSAVFYQGDSSQSFVSDQFNMALPAAISLQADWNFYKNFFLNATIIKGFGHGNKPGVTSPDVYSITPRWENKWFEVSVPLSAIYYKHWQARAGLAVRAGYFFIGGDALGSLLTLNDLEGGDFYAGVHFFIPQKKLKDHDEDKVSDKLDQCPEEKGTCLTRGCPDRDNDGVIDKEDDCPDQPGPAYLKGCPDRDNDSIPDKDDQCPDLKGPRSLYGCPDTDGDGIIDPEDSCVTVKGLPQFHGCPDTDSDGIPDNKDECPNEAGPANTNGCPDRDHDGVADKKDNCPDVAGPVENNGCPAGVPQEIGNQLLITSQKVQFKINSSTVRQDLYPVLDQIIASMKQYPNVKWSIEGYADATGSEEYNLKLSQRRAEAVRDYLVKKGIPVENLSAKGMGETNPLTSNKTAPGRAKNRRVEIRELK